MTRGNQRFDQISFNLLKPIIYFFSSELAREKNMKNQKSKGQSAADTDANKGLSLQERQMRDAQR